MILKMFRALGVALAFAAIVQAQRQREDAARSIRISPDLAVLANEDGSDIIVQHREGSGKRTRAMRVRGWELNRLAIDPDVEYVTPDRDLAATVAPWEYMSALGYPFAGLLVPERPFYEGDGVGVAILDSGISTDKYFNGGLLCLGKRIVYEQNFVTNENTANDLYGHGTHVAGIVAGSGDCLSFAAKAMSGIAPKVNLLNMRVLDKRGQGKDSYVIAAIDQADLSQGTGQVQHSRFESVVGTSGAGKLQARSAVPGGGAGLEGRHRGRHCGGQRGTRQQQGHQGLRHDRISWQRSLRDHSGSNAHAGSVGSFRRHRGLVQFQRTGADRPHREAGSGGARQSHCLADGSFPVPGEQLFSELPAAQLPV
jgi:subtilisin family serine protease